MTLGNMRANGVRSLAVSCHLWHHEAVLSADRWPDHMAVPAFGPRMVCTPMRHCRRGRPAELAGASGPPGGGIVGADTRPNWPEQPARETLTGVQWR
jgi:hypothetical protein